MKFNPLLPWEEQKIAWGMKDIFSVLQMEKQA